MTEDFYTERLLRFPHSFLCYQPPKNTPDVIELPAKTIKRITFGSFNNLPKITKSVIDLWAKVLHAVPNSRIILKINWFDDAGTRDRSRVANSLLGDRAENTQNIEAIYQDIWLNYCIQKKT